MMPGCNGNGRPPPGRPATLYTATTTQVSTGYACQRSPWAAVRDDR